jgi:hypothetical protein
VNSAPRFGDAPGRSAPMQLLAQTDPYSSSTEPPQPAYQAHVVRNYEGDAVTRRGHKIDEESHRIASPGPVLPRVPCRGPKLAAEPIGTTTKPNAAPRHRRVRQLGVCSARAAIREAILLKMRP